MRVVNNLKERFIAALSLLKINRQISFLLLFGVAIGIFEIILVFTINDYSG